MVVASMFFEKNPPRLAQGMAEKFLNRWPFFSEWTTRLGQLTGLPETAERLLNDDRLLMVFPEGARGTAKLYRDRWNLVDFGTGFVRLAMKTRTPIIPFAFIGGGDAVPTVTNLYRLGKLFGAPYFPITPYLLPIPRPVKMSVIYGEPIYFEGTGTEDDEVVFRLVERVKSQIAALMERGRAERREPLALEGR
jgi:1-acyl-sn-glycerol-3-phosphate acyltransferase